MDHHKLITRASLLLNPCDAQLVSDFHEVNAFVLGFFIEEPRKSIWRYKSATPKSPATNRKWVSSSDVRLALDIQLSDTCWPDGRLANLVALWKAGRPNTALEAPKCECAAERKANSASRVHDALDSHRKLCNVLQRDINRPSANASGL